MVRDRVRERADMKAGGVPAWIEVRPAYAPALLRLGRCSHIWVLCWLHKADRRVLRAAPRKVSAALGERGVFALRSPDRPNPVSLSCVRLREVRGRRIKVEGLDVIDGTPVIDIKPYSAGIDSVPSAAQPDYSRKYRLVDDGFLRSMLERVARNHCGGLGREARQAADLAFRFIRACGRARPSSAVRTNLRGAGVDALYGIFGLRPSSRLIKSVPSRGRGRWLETRTGGRLQKFHAF